MLFKYNRGMNERRGLKLPAKVTHQIAYETFQSINMITINRDHKSLLFICLVCPLNYFRNDKNTCLHTDVAQTYIHTSIRTSSYVRI